MVAAQGQQGDGTHLNSRPAHRTGEAMRWARAGSEKGPERLELGGGSVCFVYSCTALRLHDFTSPGGMALRDSPVLVFNAVPNPNQRRGNNLGLVWARVAEGS
jgi:hypothetical protein